MFTIQITTGRDAPIFRQIVEQIRAATAGGKLRTGDPLPSVRGLVINHNTVARAYLLFFRTRTGIAGTEAIRKSDE
ncbi:GntR family transcriptional regulator [Novipirellula sp.]|uniref:GntR family transcriptional regulator n=1 Tax=Novipirellula sp. TaxID=2795430 RepID=UPI0035689331